MADEFYEGQRGDELAIIRELSRLIIHDQTAVSSAITVTVTAVGVKGEHPHRHAFVIVVDQWGRQHGMARSVSVPHPVWNDVPSAFDTWLYEVGQFAYHVKRGEYAGPLDLSPDADGIILAAR